MESQAEIKWPDRFDPNRAPVHVRNELTMDVPCESVWAWLVRAESWPSWYANSADVRFIEGQGPDLKLGTRFKWKTFGVHLVSKVLEFVPNERLAWDAKGSGVAAYHVWILQKTDSGCKVVTEEAQIGTMARLQNRFRPNRMHEQHQKWLEGLEGKTRTGKP
jgi:uncharacterized protein YndB with AHSA1/START domain